MIDEQEIRCWATTVQPEFVGLWLNDVGNQATRKNHV